MIGAVDGEVGVDAAGVMERLDAAVLAALEIWNSEETVASSTARTRKAAVRDWARWLVGTGGPEWDSRGALGALPAWVAAHQDSLSSAALSRRRRDIRLFCEFWADWREGGEGSLFGAEADSDDVEGADADGDVAGAVDEAVREPDETAGETSDLVAAAELSDEPAETDVDGGVDDGAVVWAEDSDEDASGGAGGVGVELERAEARSATVRAAMEELVARKRSRERGSRPVELN